MKSIRLPALTLLALLTMPALAADPPAGGFAIRDVRVFDGERMHERRTVVVEGDLIAAVGGPRLATPGLRAIDGRGHTLLPGLIDSHVHLPDAADAALGQAATFGVTTVIDMFSAGSRLQGLKRLAAADAAGLADLRTAGVGAAAPGGHPTQMGGPAFPTITRAADAQAFVDARLAEGSDFLKIINDDLSALGFEPRPKLDRDTLAALIDAAHRRGRKAMVHVGSEDQAREAIGLGADGIVHLFVGQGTSPGFGAFVARRRAFAIPTLSTLYVVCGRSQGPTLLADARLLPWLGPDARASLERTWRKGVGSCDAADQAIRQLRRAGAVLLAGTDAPSPGTTYGASLHGELALMVRAGLSPVEALKAATSAPARVFGLNDRGAIKPGRRADLLLVAGDPSRDIEASRHIVAVWKRGQEVARPVLDTPRATGLP